MPSSFDLPASLSHPLLPIPYREFMLNRVREKGAPLQDFMKQILIGGPYSFEQEKTIRDQFHGILGDPNALKTLLEVFIRARQYILETDQNKREADKVQPQILLENHKRIHIMVSFLYLLGEEWYGIPELEAVRGPFLKGLFSDLAVNLSALSQALAKGELIENSQEWIACFDQEQNIIEKIRSPIQRCLQQTSSCFERAQLLPIITQVLFSFKYKATLQYAQGKTEEARLCMEASETYYFALKPLFLALQKKGMQDAMGHYQNLGGKMKFDFVRLTKDNQNNVKRKLYTPILRATLLFRGPMLYQRGLKDGRFQVEFLLPKLAQLKTITPESLECIQSNIKLLQDVLRVNYEDDLYLIRSCETIIEHLQSLLLKEPPSLIILEIQSHLLHYRMVMKDHQNRIQDLQEKKVPTNISPLQKKIETLEQENERLKTEMALKEAELREAHAVNVRIETQAKAIGRANIKEIEFLRKENKALEVQIATSRNSVPRFVAQTPFSETGIPAAVAQSSGIFAVTPPSFNAPTFEFGEDIQGVLQNRIVCDTIDQYLNQGLTGYCALLSIVTNHSTPALMFQSLYHSGFLEAMVPLSWPHPQAPYVSDWVEFVSAELGTVEGCSPYAFLNGLLLAPYQVLKQNHPKIAKAELIEQLSVELVSKIRNFVPGDEPLLKARIEKSLPILIHYFDEKRQQAPVKISVAVKPVVFLKPSLTTSLACDSNPVATQIKPRSGLYKTS